MLATFPVPGNAQFPPGSPRFDVASVKPYKPVPGQRPQSPTFHADAGRIEYHIAGIRELVLKAWPLADYAVAWPPWMCGKNPLFDVSATMPVDTTPEQLRLMLQGLLADRFKLTAHRETRDVPVYALEISSRGLKIRKAANPPDHQYYGGGSTSVERRWNFWPKSTLIFFKTQFREPPSPFLLV